VPDSRGRTDAQGVSPEHATEDLLDSWKEIAAYLKRDISTVQRWEKREGLPIHRHIHDKLGSVFGFKSELDIWSKTRAVAIRSSKASTKPQQRRIRSLAVLPLENLSGNSEEDYFVDGMTEALIATVATMSSLRVISRTSVMTYKKSVPSLRDVARTLRVDAVLEGSVVRAGDRVRITAHLIDATNDAHLWTGTYDRATRDILALQSEVARAIATTLNLTLTTHEQAVLERTDPIDPLAHELYLKGKYHYQKYTQIGFEKARDYCNQAIAVDPSYARAYAGLSDSLILLGLYHLRPHDAFPPARVAALKAIELDSTLSAPHVALGFVKMLYEWDWVGSQQEATQALKLEPNSAKALTLQYYVFTNRAELDNALECSRYARKLDPLSLFNNFLVAVALFTMRRYDEAWVEAQNVLELNSQYPLAHHVLGLILEQEGRYAEAIVELEKAVGLFGDRFISLGALGRIFGLSGQPLRAREVLEHLESAGNNAQAAVDPAFSAMIHAGLGENDLAFGKLNEACEYHSTHVVWLKSAPYWDPLRSDPRFDTLLARLGLSS